MKLGTENRKNVVLAAVLGVVAILAIIYELMPASSTIASTGTTTGVASVPSTVLPHPTGRHGGGSASAKKERAPQSLDPTLQLQQLAAIEKIKYEVREETSLYRKRTR